MYNKILIMLTLQNQMNSKVNPDWIKAGQNWLRAIWIEAAELVGHLSWKWWKKEEVNIPQAQIEAVDIWHFALSMMIESHFNQQNIPDAVVDNTLLEAVAKRIDDGFTQLAALNDYQNEIGAIRYAEAVVGGATDHQHSGFNMHAFKHLLTALDMSFDQLFNQYVGKNILNIFRQDHGYKAGTYVKHWDGREDNEHLQDIMEALDCDSATYADDILKELEIRYAQYSQVA